MLRIISSRPTTLVVTTVGLATGLLFIFRHLSRRQRATRKHSYRVLVTGFNDWRNIDTHGIWKSNENPSSRLILGEPSDFPSIARQGPLAVALNKKKGTEDLHNVEWSFMTLPTLWRVRYCMFS
jgi:hypothetical protein